MALVQMIEMNKIVNEIAKRAKKKAEKLGVERGVIVVCYNNDKDYADLGRNKCFDDLSPGEDRIRAFSLRSNDSFIDSLDFEEDNFHYFGAAVMEVAVAAEAHSLIGKSELISRSSSLKPGYGGCVMYPLTINNKPCGNIYVAVAGGTETQNEICAWEAYKPIANGLIACKTSNPGPDKYGKPEE